METCFSRALSLLMETSTMQDGHYPTSLSTYAVFNRSPPCSRTTSALMKRRHCPLSALSKHAKPVLAWMVVCTREIRRRADWIHRRLSNSDFPTYPVTRVAKKAILAGELSERYGETSTPTCMQLTLSRLLFKLHKSLSLHDSNLCLLI